MVFEYCAHDLSRLLDTMSTPFTEAEVKCLMKQARVAHVLCILACVLSHTCATSWVPRQRIGHAQLLEGVVWLHSHWVMHRDLKLSNLLMTSHGRLRLCDFGLARYSQAYEEPCTPNVVTLWYR